MQILMEFCELKEEEDVLKDPYLSQQICAIITEMWPSVLKQLKEFYETSLEPCRGGRLLVRMSVVGAICTAGLWHRGISLHQLA